MEEIILNDIDQNQFKLILEDDFYNQGMLTIEINVDGYYVKGPVWMVTGELACFYTNLVKMYSEMKGQAVLVDTENQLELIFSFTKRGYVLVKGRYKKNHDRNNEIIFEFESTQPQLLETIEMMKEIGSLKGHTYW